MMEKIEFDAIESQEILPEHQAYLDTLPEPVKNTFYHWIGMHFEDALGDWPEFIPNPALEAKNAALKAQAAQDFAAKNTPVAQPRLCHPAAPHRDRSSQRGRLPTDARDGEAAEDPGRIRAGAELQDGTASKDGAQDRKLARARPRRNAD